MMCANKENKYSLTPCPFHSKRYGCLESQHLSTPYWLSYEVGDKQTHTSATVVKVKGQTRHPPLFTVFHWFPVIAVLKPHLQEQWLLQAVEGAETVFCFVNFPLKYLSITLPSAQLHTIHCTISSPAL